MYQNCCKKCGSVSLHTEQKGSNTGLYCDDCGAWIKWLGKDELRAFEYSMRSATKDELEQVDNYISSIAKDAGNNFFQESTIVDRLNRFVDFLEKEIDNEMSKFPISVEDSIRKNSYCMALEKDKNAIISILNGKEYYDLVD